MVYDVRPENKSDQILKPVSIMGDQLRDPLNPLEHQQQYGIEGFKENVTALWYQGV